MKKLLFLLLFPLSVFATNFTDLQFGRSQIADSQWNVGACLYTASCQIYSKNPGTMYKIPWTSGQWQWQSGQYLKFEASGNASFPWVAKVYNSNGSLAGTVGTGKVVNLGTTADGKAYFFFVGTDNNTGQLFSMSEGMNTTSGLTFNGTLNPDATVLNTYSTNYGSTTPLAAGQTSSPAPSLCCGGSSASFNMNITNAAKLATFKNRTTADTKVYIDQIGNSNKIIVNQEETMNNYVKYEGNGSFNDIHIKQTSTTPTATNYTDLTVNGNSNTVSITQRGGGGEKSAFVNIADNNNSLTLDQKNSGSHYAEINLSGGNKTVDVLQQGGASHMASITLSGQPVGLSLTQQGGTQQFYSINFNCATTGGCQAISVTQGQ